MAKEDPVGYPDFTLPVVHVGAITVEGSVSVLGTVEVKGAVTVSGTVSVSGTVEVTGAVTVSGTVSISGTVTVTGSVTVSGTVSISGTVTVSGSVTVTGAVTVGTVAADNIVIDKLTVGAYTERRSTLSNNGASPADSTPFLNNWRGKFFPRGCRGFIEKIEIYVSNVGGPLETVTFGLHRTPYSGEIWEVQLTVPAGQSAAWISSANIRRFWEYDSLYIKSKAASGGNSRFYWDYETPYDCYDEGVTPPFSMGWRAWWRAVYAGQTVGDVPVSGTLNTIDIPSTGAGAESGSISVPSGAETSIITVTGAGTVERVAIFTGEDIVEIRFYVDGVLFNRYALLAGEYFMAIQLNTLKYSVSTPQIQLMSYVAEGMCYFNVTMPFPFKRSFEVRAYHVAAAARAVRVGLVYELLG